MFNSLRRKILTGFSSSNSLRIKEKVVVFESDDWGGIRTPSLNAMSHINSLDSINKDSPYGKYDTVENSADLDLLLNTLSGFKDKSDRNPIITANFVTANPDFEAIENDFYKQYFYQSFDKIYEEYYPNQNVANKLREAVTSGLIKPQFHGREHVNVGLWLANLQNADPILTAAFKLKFWGIQTQNILEQKKNLQAAFDHNDQNTSKEIGKNISEGLQLFYDFFGFHSTSFVPNNYIWDPKNNHILADNGIKYLQGIKIQTFPLSQGDLNRKSNKRNPGQIEQAGLLSIVRNGSFEPSLQYQNRSRAVDLCLADINAAFMWQQPAVISTHRINFVSGLSVENRDKNLKLFQQLLTTIKKKWPDVVFLNTEELGKMYEQLK